MGLWRRVVSRLVPDVDVPRPGGDLGGVPSRAVIVKVRARGYRDHSIGITHDPWGKGWFNLDLTLRHASGSDLREVDVRAYVRERATVIATAGLDVPVRVDPASGAILGLDAEAFDAEARSLDAQYEAQGGRGPAPTAADVLAIDAGDAAFEPIAGVGFETFLAVDVGLTRDGIHGGAQEDYAVACGVPAGCWAEASKGWQQRMRKDMRLGTQYGAAHAAAARSSD